MSHTREEKEDAIRHALNCLTGKRSAEAQLLRAQEILEQWSAVLDDAVSELTAPETLEYLSRAGVNDEP